MSRRQVQISLPDHLDEYYRKCHIPLSKFVQKALEEHSGRQDKGLEQQAKETEQAISDLQTSLAIKKASLGSIREEITVVHEKKKTEELELKKKEQQCKNCGNDVIASKLIYYSGYCQGCFNTIGYKETKKKKPVSAVITK